MRFFTGLVILILTIGLTACSNGAGITPELDQSMSEFTDNESTPLYISDYDESGNPTGGMGLLGTYTGLINPVTQTAELTPLRDSSLTDTLEVVDITSFMTSGVCTDCVHLKSISLDGDGNPVLSIGVKHPFGAGDPLKPISGMNRGDLHVFNVEGIVAIQSTGSTDFTSLGVTTASKDLKNADGLTSYLDPYLDEILLTDATAHPYILHFDDYTVGNFDPLNPMGFESVTTPPPSGNLVMPMGSDYDYQDYVFNIPDGENTQFIYAVGCTYAVSSSSKSERFSPEYRVPQHNKKAASEVRVEVTSNDLLPGDISSTAELTISILDINHAVETGSELNQMALDSSVANLIYEIPGITSGTQSDYLVNGGDGRDPLNPLSFIATVTNTAGGDTGSYLGLLKVLDSYPPGQNELPLLGSMDGIKRVDPTENPLSGLFDITEFATYSLFEIDISFLPEDPIAIIKTTPDPPDVTTQYPSVTFDGSSSYDPDGGSITLFEWDFDWDDDPLNFVPDLSGSESLVDHFYDDTCSAGSYTAGLRVTDDDTPAGVSTITSVEVNITVGTSNTTWEGSTDLGVEFIQGMMYNCTTDALHVDSNGIVHLISNDGNYTTPGRIHHRTWNGTTLSAPDTFEYSGRTYTPTTALDDDDELHVVWYDSSSPMQINHMVTSNQLFTGSTDVIYTLDSGYNFRWLNIESNDSGDIMVTWIRYSDHYQNAHFMWAVDQGSGFTTPAVTVDEIWIEVSSSGNHHVGPTLEATPNGKFHQVYYSLKDHYSITTDRALYEIVFDGSVWEPVRTIYYAYPPYDLFVESDSDGDLHIIGPSFGNRMRYFRYVAATDTWLSPIWVVNNSWSWGSLGDLDVDDAGNVHMVYCDETDKYNHYKVFCKDSDEATILSTPDYILDNSTLSIHHGDTNVLLDDGKLFALYQDSKYLTGDDHLYFNILEF